MTSLARLLVLSLLMLALALPMRLHGLMVMPAHAVAAADADASAGNGHHKGHGHHQGHGHPMAMMDAGHAQHHPSPVEQQDGTKTSVSHASLHCATAGLVVPGRLAELPQPRLAVFEALLPAEMPLAEGLVPTRQERPPRQLS